MIISFLALDGAQGVHYYVVRTDVKEEKQLDAAAGLISWRAFDQYQGVKASSHPFIFI